ncbi:unnamed protein product [Musa banksii]
MLCASLVYLYRTIALPPLQDGFNKQEHLLSLNMSIWDMAFLVAMMMGIILKLASTIKNSGVELQNQIQLAEDHIAGLL